MQPTPTAVQQAIQTITKQAVASVDLMPDASQPAGATGDARLVTVNFSDETLPVNIKLADLKAVPAAYTTQATNMTANAAKATENATKMASVVALTTSF